MCGMRERKDTSGPQPLIFTAEAVSAYGSKADVAWKFIPTAKLANISTDVRFSKRSGCETLQ